jgi:hypothetical protein
MSDQGETQSPSIRDRIGAFLRPETQQPQEEPVAEVPQEEVVTGEEAPQVAEEAPEAPVADPTADWAEVEVDGEMLQVPPKFAKAFMQERDYTQKRQADAEYRKALEVREYATQVREQSMAQLQPLYAQAQIMEGAVQQWQRFDWEALRANDPLEYAAKRADYAALLQQRGDLHRHIEGAHQNLSQQNESALAQAIAASQPIIRKAIPDWGADKDSAVTRYALEAGASPFELRQYVATRPWAVVALEKARKYDELQASKAQLPKQTKPLSPVAKPGAKPTVQNVVAASYRKNQETFRKSGGKDKAALRALIKAKVTG